MGHLTFEYYWRAVLVSCLLGAVAERDFHKKRNEDLPLEVTAPPLYQTRIAKSKMTHNIKEELSLKSPLHSAIGNRRDRSTIGGILTIRWTQAREPHDTEILPAGLVNYTYPWTKMAREKYTRVTRGTRPGMWSQLHVSMRWNGEYNKTSPLHTVNCAFSILNHTRHKYSFNGDRQHQRSIYRDYTHLGDSHEPSRNAIHGAHWWLHSITQTRSYCKLTTS